MFCKTVIVCVCVGALYGVEEDYAPPPNSHLSFIFKEKQKESEGKRPRWDFLLEPSEENGEFPLLFDGPLFTSAGSTGATGSAPRNVSTPFSLSAPNRSLNASMQNASRTVNFLKSHQNLLSTLFNPKIQGNEAEGSGMAFDGKGFDESQYIAQADIDGKNPRSLFSRKGHPQNTSQQEQLPSGTTRILGHEGDKNDLWVALFGEKLKFPSHPGVNTVRNTSLGFLIGYDRFISSGMLTGAIGYNHFKTTVAGHVGNGHENQIFGVFHGTAYLPKRMYLGYSLYGSANLNEFHRFVNTGTQRKVAKSSFSSGTLDPHITFGYDWCVNDWFIVEPFISNDFVFNFQPSYSEKGAPGFNEHQEALNSGLYVGKPGVNFYQRFRQNWGLVILRQEAAYERVQPMFGTTNTGAIIGVQSGISTPTGLRELNLFIFEFQAFSRTNNGFYGEVFYQGGWGSEMISNALYLKVGSFF